MHTDAGEVGALLPKVGSLPLELIGTTPVMAQLLYRARQYAPADDVVVIVGEPGTGKSLLAHALHVLSGRKGPFGVMTARELSSMLGPDVLFGSRRGAYTGSVRDRAGLLARMAFGTFGFEDFHHLDPADQLLLLRVFEERRWRAHGEDDERTVTCRLVVITCEHPDALVAAGRMSREIRSRLGLLVLVMPDLDERRKDIPALARHFLAERVAALPGGPTRIAQETLRVLKSAAYPEHVRTLRSIIHKAYLHATGEPQIRVAHLPEEVLRLPRAGAASARLDAVDRCTAETRTGQTARRRRRVPSDAARDATRVELVAAVEAHGWNLQRAARTLGIARATLYRRLRAAGLVRPPRRLSVSRVE